jgi:hypothetical protein
MYVNNVDIACSTSVDSGACLINHTKKGKQHKKYSHKSITITGKMKLLRKARPCRGSGG